MQADLQYRWQRRWSTYRSTMVLIIIHHFHRMYYTHVDQHIHTAGNIVNQHFDQHDEHRGWASFFLKKRAIHFFQKGFVKIQVVADTRTLKERRVPSIQFLLFHKEEFGNFVTPPIISRPNGERGGRRRRREDYFRARS